MTIDLRMTMFLYKQGVVHFQLLLQGVYEKKNNKLSNCLLLPSRPSSQKGHVNRSLNRSANRLDVTVTAEIDSFKGCIKLYLSWA